MSAGPGPGIAGAVHPGQRMRIRLELDTDPPPGFRTEARVLLRPIPFSVRVCDLPSLFAGKMHPGLCRDWTTRVKGRDRYCFVRHVGRGTKPEPAYPEAGIRRSGHFQKEHPLCTATLARLLDERIETVDPEKAKVGLLFATQKLT